MKKRIISLVLALMMLLSCMPLTVFATEEACTIRVESAQGVPGSTVKVGVVIENNPGILGATLKLSWDTGLTLTGVECGEAFSMLNMTKPSNWQVSGGNYIFYGEALSDSEIVDGSILDLTFAVAEDTVFGTSYGVRISYADGDIFDKDLQEVSPAVENGSVEVSYLPGDVNGDERINALDLILLCRFIADGSKNDPDGYNTKINELAGDVDANGRWNALDLIYICRYIADGCVTDPNGYNVTLKPSGLVHTHRMTEFAAKDASCTENGNIAYWYCAACGKYFDDAEGATEIALADTVIAAAHIPGDAPTCTAPQSCTVCGETITEALGHVEVTVPGYDATYEEPGLTDGVQCSTCGEWLVMQEEYGPLHKDVLFVNYILDSGTDTYLKNYLKGVDEASINPNPKEFNTTEKSHELEAISRNAIPGYIFNGWVNSYGDPIRTIEKGATGERELIAVWIKEQFIVDLDTPDVEVDIPKANQNEHGQLVYTVDMGVSIPAPEQFGYTFVGWSDDNGFIVNRIEPGTTGNIRLHANWTSNRNKAVSYADYGKPIIIEDNEKGHFLFVYSIGRIENIPLAVCKYADGSPISKNGELNVTIGTEIKTGYTYEDSQQVINKVANATTRSSGWTLSEDWAKLYEVSEGENITDGKTIERVDSVGNIVGGRFLVSNSQGGESYTSSESGASSSVSAKVTTEESYGIKSSYNKKTEDYQEEKLETKNEFVVGVNASLSYGVAKVSGEVKNTHTTNETELNTRRDETSLHVDGEISNYVGTDTSSSSTATYKSATSNSASWNTDESYEKSMETSKDTTVSNAILTEIAKTATYSMQNSLAGTKENVVSSTGEEKNEIGYYNSIITTKQDETKTTIVQNYSSALEGEHRLVTAGTAHVYGVVGYDVATASYYTYTYNVLEDETRIFHDYSTFTSSFNDCENGLITFEIPIEVNDYIAAITGETAGLEHDHNGKITAFEQPEGFDGTVVLPQYYSVNNSGDDFEAYKTTGFDASVFAGNTEIKTVILPLYVTEIPAGAFSGCTSLETIVALGVTKIGKNAFKGCSSLKSFAIDNMVTELGENAFSGAFAEGEGLSVMAANAAVADAAIKSGAKRITLDLSKIDGGYNNREILIDDTHEYFGLIGDDSIVYTNLSIQSNATETYIKDVVLADNNGLPLEIGSSKLTLVKIVIENAPNLALLLTQDDVTLKLLGDVTVSSASGNAILSKNVTFSKLNSSVQGKLVAEGKYIICGELTGDDMLTVNDPREENIVYIEASEFDLYQKSFTVAFDVDGGTSVASQTLPYNTKATEPAKPTKTKYKFIGWYTDEECTTAFDFSTPITADITLHAKWELNQFTIRFNANGGSVSTSSLAATYGAVVGTLPTPTPTNTAGYTTTFAGWYTAASGGTKVTSGTVFDIDDVDGSITLYAHWAKTANTYTVAFNANGGSVSQTSKSVTYNSTYGTLPTPTRTGYTFNGWYTAQTGGTKISSSTKYTVVGNQTLYAQWSRLWYSIIFDPNGGTVSPTYQTVGYDKTYGELPTPTRTGYTFNGWYTSDGEKIVSSTKVSKTQEHTLYAKWTANDYTYNVVYKSSNGTSLGSATITHAYNTTNTITPKSFAGYTTPASQSIKWDSTSAKTITFEYKPIEVATTQELKSGVWSTSEGGTDFLTYVAGVEIGERTASTVQIRVVWTNKIMASPYYCGFSQYFKATIGGEETGDVLINSNTAWKNPSSSVRTKTVYSNWLTVPVTATQTSVSLSADWWSSTSNGSFSADIAISAY